ncbi:gamma-glutamyltransferase family protein [Nakamurella aerolata]|uniref:Gamma-glutamyltransferase family protein n=1 Tax=Nakamurella aerolata TaxID=1656892 RepID=A0A849AAJ7_9ACTN|nr:gamma-glutamyltransferase [Nakamurella aerolata]NNG37555.1 gamma-glutamyltransferase family protein [Nakamurella aerolata]
MTAPATPAFTTRPELTGTFGMVASTHYLTSAAGMAELEAGGNAIDAAVAAGFTLQVVEPHLNGPGGDMTLLYALQDGVPQVLCGQGPAPAGATAQAMRQRGLDRVPGSGVAAAAIPASTVAWLTLLRDHGTRSLADVLKYAIHYAATGFPVLPQIERTIATVAELLRTSWADSAALYLTDAGPVPAGSMLCNPALAGTYRRLLDAGTGRDRDAAIDAAIEAWSTGFVAEAIDAFCRTEQDDGLGGRYTGLLTGDDLAGFRPHYEAPVTADFHGWTVAKSGAWGQGPVLLQQLRLLDDLDPASTPPLSAEWVHRIVEASKLAFADRDAWYGDPAADQPPVPIHALLSDSYTQQRRELIGEQASGELRPGSPDGRTPVLPDWSTGSTPVGATTGEPTVGRDGRTKGDTCHVSVVDAGGRMVAATPSGGWLHSSPLIGALGFPLGTRLQMTTLEPGLPTTLRPGGRPRTTLSPSLARHTDGRRLAFGTPGGDQQDQWQLGFFLNHVLAGMNLQQAIDAPAFHSTHFPSSFYPREAFPKQLIVEDRFGAELIDGLRRLGHDVVVSGPWSLGRLSAVSRAGAGASAPAVLRAGANPRGMQGYAVGR